MRLIHGVAYNSKGKYKTRVNGKMTKSYGAWRSMIGRCYDPKSHVRRPTYIECFVAEEWLDYQVFGEWFENQEYSDCEYHLDKDILIPGNNVYGPETCAFTPMEINQLFGDKPRGEYPIGVTVGYSGKFLAGVKINSKQKHLGTFDTVQEAYTAYRVAKEANVKEVAEYWKDKIDSRVYEALTKWELPK